MLRIRLASDLGDEMAGIDGGAAAVAAAVAEVGSDGGTVQMETEVEK